MSKQTAVEFLLDNMHYSTSTKWQDIIEQAKKMEKEQIFNFLKINRVEVIQHSPPYNGRAYTNYDAKDVEIQFQDNNETLKIFLK